MSIQEKIRRDAEEGRKIALRHDAVAHRSSAAEARAQGKEDLAKAHDGLADRFLELAGDM